MSINLHLKNNNWIFCYRLTPITHNPFHTYIFIFPIQSSIHILKYKNVRNIYTSEFIHFFYDPDCRSINRTGLFTILSSDLILKGQSNLFKASQQVNYHLFTKTITTSQPLLVIYLRFVGVWLLEHDAISIIKDGSIKNPYFKFVQSITICN